jgi:hypothetical protein
MFENASKFNIIEQQIFTAQNSQLQFRTALVLKESQLLLLDFRMYLLRTLLLNWHKINICTFKTAFAIKE